MGNKFAVSRCCCSVCPTCSRNFSSVVLKPFTTSGPYYNPVYETAYPPSTLGLPKYNLNNVLNNHTSTSNFSLGLMNFNFAPYNYPGYSLYNFGMNTVPLYIFQPFYNPLYLDRGFNLTGESICMYRFNRAFLAAGLNFWNSDVVNDVDITDPYYFDSLSPYFNFPSFSTPVPFSVYNNFGYSLAIVKNPRINYVYRHPSGSPTTSTEVYSNTGTYMIGCLTINIYMQYVGWNSFGGTHPTADNQNSSRTILYTPKLIENKRCCINYNEPSFLDLQDSRRFAGYGGSLTSSLPVYEYMGPDGTLTPTVEISCD